MSWQWIHMTSVDNHSIDRCNICDQHVIQSRTPIFSSCCTAVGLSNLGCYRKIAVQHVQYWSSTDMEASDNMLITFKNIYFRLSYMATSRMCESVCVMALCRKICAFAWMPCSHHSWLKLEPINTCDYCINVNCIHLHWRQKPDVRGEGYWFKVIAHSNYHNCEFCIPYLPLNPTHWTWIEFISSDSCTNCITSVFGLTL